MNKPQKAIKAINDLEVYLKTLDLKPFLSRELEANILKDLKGIKSEITMAYVQLR